MTAIDFAFMFEDCLNEVLGDEAAAPALSAEERHLAQLLVQPPPAQLRALPVPHADCDLHADAVTEEEEAALLTTAYASAKGDSAEDWHDLSGRRLLNLGGAPHPEGCLVEALPGWARAVCERAGAVSGVRGINQVLLNEYKDGQGIAAHKDGDHLYAKEAVVLSLVAGAEMVFRPDDGGETLRLHLPPRSLLRFRGALFSDYTHEIPVRRMPEAPPLRLSFTMRHALLQEEIPGTRPLPSTATQEGRAETERRRSHWIRAVSDADTFSS